MATEHVEVVVMNEIDDKDLNQTEEESAREEPLKKPRRKRWATLTFGPEQPSLEPFDLSPVTDIPIRLAIEQGAIKRYKDLALYKTKEEWEGYPEGTIVLAGPIEEGRQVAIWLGNPPSKKEVTSKQAKEEGSEISDHAEDENRQTEDASDDNQAPVEVE